VYNNEKQIIQFGKAANTLATKGGREHLGMLTLLYLNNVVEFQSNFNFQVSLV
jgi:hypothetical protein